ncbi:MAG: carboxylating nicotinate-nucleotide diphosphorylase [Actinomycetes bacterium]
MTVSLDPPAGILREVVALALREDLGLLGDLTSIAVIPEETLGSARFVSRVDGVLAGTAAATEVFRQIDSDLVVAWTAPDGAELEAGLAFGSVSGPLRSILAGERTALNLLQHCSGVATLTRRYVRSTHGRAQIRDTRKTLPGLRALDKAAVRAGGGFNHRESLSDAVLIKDNHLVHHDLVAAVGRARAHWPGRIVEVECDTLDQVRAAVLVAPDLILLDNMTPEEVREARAIAGPDALLEVSGGVTIDTVGDYAGAGATFISVGAITHSAPALDLGLDLD